ncbi:MAG: O-antigen ligase family protein, partial [Elusimicrobiota bacterium]
MKILEGEQNIAKTTTPFILWGIPIVYFSIVVAFYLRTYDSAQVKITLTQMGIASVFGLWLMEKIQDRRLGLSTEFLPVYAPFFAFLASGILSFAIQAPYKPTNLDEFTRRLLYISVALMVFDRVRGKNVVERILKFLLLGLFCSTFYGLIQFLDSRFFEPNPGMGIDIFIWRQAFGKRIFSTFGNPNFYGDYLVLMCPIVVCWALVRKSVAAWCLLALTMFNIVFTETKGAWVGTILTAFMWTIFYATYINAPLALFLRARLKAIGLVVAAGFVTMIMLTPALNPISISFRIYTWLSTYEMIRDHPIAGIGVGSFKVIYPAYRRPQIFHIEDKHNTETDHAENEHIEVMFDEGIIGFGIYLWLILTVVILSAKTLKRWRDGGCKDERPYYLVGVTVAWLGSLVHNNFDVSIRFVSSGVFMGLLPALAANLALSDKIWNEPEPQAPQSSGPMPVLQTIALVAAKAASLVAVFYVAYRVFTEFYEIQVKMLGSSHPGDQLMVFLAWVFFVTLLGGGVYVYVRSLHKARSIFSSLVPLLLAYPVLFFWGWFRGDVHHNIAIVHSKRRAWGDAIANYTLVTKKNPGFIMAYYFLGNVFNDRWDMEPKNVPEWGDPKGVKRTDYNRAIEIYEYIRRHLAPNYVQMHYHVGNLFLKRAEYAKGNGESP